MVISQIYFNLSLTQAMQGEYSHSIDCIQLALEQAEGSNRAMLYLLLGLYYIGNSQINEG